jgi:hypothetical protein
VRQEEGVPDPRPASVASRHATGLLRACLLRCLYILAYPAPMGFAFTPFACLVS